MLTNEMKPNNALFKVVQSPLQSLKRLRHDEDGAMTIMTFFILMLMLMMGGIGVDIMRQEMHRAKLQANLDAAVLAAASAPYPSGLDEDGRSEAAENLVKDHFKKAGLEDYLNTFKEGDVRITATTSKVTASANQTLDTHLMRLSGVKELEAAGLSTAQTGVQQLEIALVIDVSGSMASGSWNESRLDAVKSAAKEFVTQIIDNSGGHVAISIVPYSFNSAPQKALYDALNANTTHHYSRCLTFHEDDFEDAYIDPNRAYAQTIYTSVDYSSWNNADFGTVGEGNVLNSSSSAYNASCYADPRFEILAYSSDEADLHDKIDALAPAGGTSSEMGVKWGAALLDPKFSSVGNALKTNAQTIPLTDENGVLTGTRNMTVNSALTTIPEDYNSSRAMKIMIIMGDGANSNSYVLEDPNRLLDPDVPENHASNDYRGPNSNLYLLNEPRAAETEMVFVRAVHVYGYTSDQEWRCSRYWYWSCEYEEVEVSGAGTGLPEPSFYLYSPTRNRYLRLDPEDDFATGEEFTPSEFNDKIEDLPEHTGILSDLSGNFDVAVDTFDLAEETIDKVEENYAEEGDKFYERFSWEEAWGLMTPYEYADITGDWGAYDQYNSRSRNRLTSDEKNARMVDVCDAANKERVRIYTIAFELGEEDSASEELEKCATISANHYNSTKLNISQTFGSIAANVLSLKLTQ